MSSRVHHNNRVRGNRGTGTGAKAGSTAAEALRLIKGGMHPLPVPYQQKRSLISGWPKLRIRKKDISDWFNSKRQNIGVILGVDGLADVDLDCPEAITAADEFLPPTDFVFGRVSTPRAHRFYRLNRGIKTKQFKDPVSGNVLLELRCLKSDGNVGFQTMVPPSIHPSGERVRYESRGEPAHVKSADLVRATKRTAAVALLARHFPGEKSGRNGAFLALAGTLAHTGSPVAAAVRVHRAIYKVLWDDAANLGQSEREVRASYEKFSAGEAVTGVMELRKFIPESVVFQALNLLGLEDQNVDREQQLPHTDLGNAQRLVERHGADLLWCDDWRNWLVWDGRCWLRDNKQAVRALAHDTVRAMYLQASKITDADQRKALADHARRSENRYRIEAMISEARPMRASTPDQFDQDRWLLNVKNGTVDLRTRELKPHRREDLITKVNDVEYAPDAKCPLWKRFLKEVFEPHPDIIPFLQRAVGYSLTGDTREESLFLLHGTGRNGKGTFIKTVAEVLGDHAGTADFSAFTPKRNDGPCDDIANMRGKRMISAQESREGAAFAESIVKWLTGGDRVRARRLYENSTEFDPSFKIWLATNHKPVIRGTDPAIWSRIKLIPFEVSFEGRENRELKEN
jgi:putative DNA primase/helicase